MAIVENLPTELPTAADMFGLDGAECEPTEIGEIYGLKDVSPELFEAAKDASLSAAVHGGISVEDVTASTAAAASSETLAADIAARTKEKTTSAGGHTSPFAGDFNKSPSIAVDLTDSDRIRWYDERDRYIDLQSSYEKDVANAAVRVDRLREQVKFTRKQMQETVEELNRVRAEGRWWLDYETPEESSEARAEMEAANARDDEGEDESEESDDDAATTTAAAPPRKTPEKFPGDWRTASIDLIGLKQNLLDKFRDASVSTIGQLEELRAKIQSGAGKWPKGIGKGKVQSITDAVVAWLDVNRDGTADTKDIPVTKVAAAEVVEIEKAVAAETAVATETATATAETAGEASMRVLGGIEGLAKSAANGTSKKPSKRGRQKKSVATVVEPVADSRDPDAPIAGEYFDPLAGKMVQSVAAGVVAESPAVATAESVTTEVPSADYGEHNTPPDDVRELHLEQRVNQLDDGSENSFDPRIKDKIVWQEGRDAFIRGWSLKDCPWTPGEKQDEWLRGFATEMNAADDGE